MQIFKNIQLTAVLTTFLLVLIACGGESMTATSEGESATEPPVSEAVSDGDGQSRRTTDVQTTQKADSVYTDLTQEKCKNVELDEEGAGYSRDLCKGAFGYDLEVIEGDIRQSINVIAPGGKKFELDFVGLVSSAFSTVGDKAEWRFRKVDGKERPFALIVRFNANEDPNSSKVTSYLTVSKITEGEICLTDVVKPVSNANAEARKLAETAPTRPCLERPE